MNKAIFASAILLIAFPFRAALAAASWHESSYDHVLGTSLELKLEAQSAADAGVAEKAALAEIDRLAAILSGYDATSEFSRWIETRGEPVRVSPELFTVLALFDAWRERTDGALNASAETANRLWQKAASRQAEPSAAELLAAVVAMGETHWRLDAAQRTATHLTDAPLRLNSLAKSYIIDRACEAALQTGKASSVVVNIGGDLVVRGRSADVVGIVDPEAAAENDEPLAHLAVRDRAVATSGDYRRGVAVDGRWHSHLIDPRTGRTAEQVRSATVVSREATQAGALATALCVLSAEEGAALARTFAGAEYLLVLADGSRMASPGWAQLEAPMSAAPMGIHAAVAPNSVGASPLAAADSGTAEVLINLEVASISGGRVKRPFVAVWIEDKDHFPVRTVALWFKGVRWLPEMRSWMHAEQIRGMVEGSRNPESIASATRGPGRYSLRWDGKDDAGKAVPPGHYTLVIEAAREHGTHQVVSSDVDISSAGPKVELAANTELSALSFEVRRKP